MIEHASCFQLADLLRRLRLWLSLQRLLPSRAVVRFTKWVFFDSSGVAAYGVLSKSSLAVVGLVGGKADIFVLLVLAVMTRKERGQEENLDTSRGY